VYPSWVGDDFLDGVRRGIESVIDPLEWASICGSDSTKDDILRVFTLWERIVKTIWEFTSMLPISELDICSPPSLACFRCSFFNPSISISVHGLVSKEEILISKG
jgi:hypothetical protein